MRGVARALGISRASCSRGLQHHSQQQCPQPPHAPVVAYTIGDRSAKSVRYFWKRLPEPYRQYHSCSDFWHAYEQLLSS